MFNLNHSSQLIKIWAHWLWVLFFSTTFGILESWIMKYKKVHQLMPLCYWLRTSNLTTFSPNPFWFLMKLSKIRTCSSHFSPIFRFCTPRNGTLDWNLLSWYAFLVISLEIKMDTDNVVTFSKTGSKKYSKRQGIKLSKRYQQQNKVLAHTKISKD